MFQNQIIFFFSCFLFLANCSWADEAITDQMHSEKLRIFELFPKSWLVLPSIEPAIPSDYIAGSNQEKFDYASSVYWGRKEDLELLKKYGPESLGDIPFQSPVLKLDYSFSVAQTGPNSFLGEDQFEQQLQSMGFRDTSIKKTNWGNYPVLVVESTSDQNHSIVQGWIGLNNPEGAVMTVSIMHSPEKKEEMMKFWDRFIEFTRPLSERESFIAMGMDMRDGYTIWSTGTASLKVTAEKRKSDGKYAILVEPISSSTTFQLQDVMGALMGSRWKHKEPCVKVVGNVIEVNGNMTNHIDTTITVLVKDVEEFSFNPDEKEHPEDVVLFQADTIRSAI